VYQGLGKGRIKGEGAEHSGKMRCHQEREEKTLKNGGRYKYIPLGPSGFLGQEEQTRGTLGVRV